MTSRGYKVIACHKIRKIFNRAKCNPEPDSRAVAATQRVRNVFMLHQKYNIINSVFLFADKEKIPF